MVSPGKIPFDQNQAMSDGLLPDQMVDLYQHDEENGNEDFSCDESMNVTAIDEEDVSNYVKFFIFVDLLASNWEPIPEQKMDPDEYDDEDGDEEFSGEESMHMIIIKRRKVSNYVKFLLSSDHLVFSFVFSLP